ncbi:MAG: hypothetical protein ACRC2T_16215 [Thermoguttaceae bacterium]
MSENTTHKVSPLANRVIIILGIICLILVVIGGGWMLVEFNKPVKWSMCVIICDATKTGTDVAKYGEYIAFAEPKMILFRGEFEPDRSSSGSGGSFSSSPVIGWQAHGNSSSNGVMQYEYTSSQGKSNWKLFDNKYQMTISEKGNVISFNDGKRYDIAKRKGKPIWLYLHDNGTIEELNELPVGFEEVATKDSLFGFFKNHPDMLTQKQ